MTLVRPESTISVAWRLCDGPRAAAQARRLVHDVLTSVPVSAESVEDVALAVSELVGNAVLHGEPPIELVLSIDQGGIHAAVVDSGPGSPLMHPTDLEAERGRGMAIVSDLSLGRFGFCRSPYTTEQGRYGKAVWCTIPTEILSGAVKR
ncbi:ATP-binding protein [Thermopolyspora sp. NPDC052614]|uniref:ATP-binding protein n=1 Tax=Thermopolyspora sp. NPDC052614 TaxID=3155682 RepID=UPI003446E649